MRWHASAVQRDADRNPLMQERIRDGVAVARGVRRKGARRPLAGDVQPEGETMLHYAIVFFVIALVAALFGFGGIAAGAAEIAKILFFIFLVIAVVTFIASLIRKA
jgi:uncharacterized membrane protein YtjA (UPF0391 family)